MNKIIGRESELELLDKYNKSGKSEFVALYGRRHCCPLKVVDVVKS